MRNLKKFLAVLVVIAMMATTMVSAFAAADASLTPSEKAVGLGLLLGGTNGVDDEYLSTETQRIQTAIIYLRLLGKEAEARAYTASTDNFDDADLVKDIPEAVNILAYLRNNPSLGWVGNGTSFNPLGPVTGQALYKVMLTSIGYVQGLDFDYADTIGFARAKGFGLAAYVGGAPAVTNSNMAAALMEALGLPMANKTTTLADKLVADKVIDAEVAAKFTSYVAPAPTASPAPVAADFTLSATNYREVVVTFNAAIDAALLVKANFTASTTDSVESVTVASDNKSVTLLLTNPIAAGGNVDITVAKAVLGAVATADVKKTLTAVTDGTLPTIASAVADGNSAINVTLSEPLTTASINNGGEYKLDGQYFSLSAVPSITGRVLTITPTSRMTKGEHTLTVTSSAKDYAGYGIAASRDVKFTVAEDTTPATVSFVSASQTELVVKFSEKLSALAIATVSFSNGATVAQPTSDDNITWTIPVSGNVFPATGSTKVTLTKTGIVDTFGNVPAADLTLDFVAQADTSRPAVTKVEFAKDVQNKLYVEFDKNIAFASGEYVLTETKSDATTATFKKSLAELTVAAFVNADDSVSKTKVVIQLVGGADFDSTSSYALLAKGVDNGPNPLLTKITDYYVSGLKVTDLTAPLFTGLIVTAQSLYITFDGALDSNSALTAANYSYIKSNDTVVGALPSAVTASLINSNKTIKLTWKNATDDTTNGITDITSLKQIQVVSLKGSDGNAIAALVQNKVALGGTWPSVGTAPSIASATVTGTNTVVVQLANFANLVYDPAQALNDIVIKNGDGLTLTKTSPVYDSTEGTITFTTIQTFAKNGTINSLGYSVYTAGTTTLKDIFAATMLLDIATGKPATDLIAPVLASTTLTPNVTFDVFTVDTSEAMTALGVATSVQLTVLVDGAPIANSTLTVGATSGAAGVGQIIITTTAPIASGATITVTFNPLATPNVKDVAGNGLATFTATYKRP